MSVAMQKGKTVVAMAAPVLMCLVLSGCTVFRAVSSRDMLRVVVGRPFVITGSDRPLGWGYYSHPVLWKLGGSAIVLLFHMHGDVPGPLGGQLISYDGGLRWTWLPVSLRRTNDVWGCVELDRGRYLVYARDLRVVRGSKTVFYCAAREYDGSWSAPFDLTLDMGFPFKRGEISPYGVKTSDGRILIPYYGIIEGERQNTAILMEYDAHRHFRKLSVIARPKDAPWGNHGPAEPCLVELPGGRLLCVMRTGSYASYSEEGGSAKMLLAESNDGGRTWRKRFFGYPGVWPRLLMMSNGILVCAFGRPGNNLMFSLDCGQTWQNEVRLTPADLHSTGYMGVAEVSADRLLVVYDVYNTSPRSLWLWEAPDERNVIYGVYLTVARNGAPG